MDQEALYNALKSEQIFAAGLDVMTPEPLPANDPLLKLPNCGKFLDNDSFSFDIPKILFSYTFAVIIPHLGTQTIKTTTEMGMVAANNILNALEGKPMISSAY